MAEEQSAFRAEEIKLLSLFPSTGSWSQSLELHRSPNIVLGCVVVPGLCGGHWVLVVTLVAVSPGSRCCRGVATAEIPELERVKAVDVYYTWH